MAVKKFLPLALLLLPSSISNGFVMPDHHNLLTAAARTATSAKESLERKQHGSSFRSNPSAGCLDGSSSSSSSSTALSCGLIAIVQDAWSESQLVESEAGTAGSNTLHPLYDAKILDATTRILDHRGPDGHRILIDPTETTGSTSDPKFAMGHTRLAIVDPDNRQADMPFTLDYTDSNTKIHLVANGEIYNHEAIYQQLIASGKWDASKRVSQSDCEVIGHAYQTLGGEATVRLLDGMFAFCLVEQDATTGAIRHVLAARDPVGIKPLYIGNSKESESTVMSSELKALVGHVDPASVVAVPAGHSWTPTDGLQRFYSPEWLMNDSYAPWKETEPTDEDVRKAFRKAVQKRMMADVEYGFFLSGGIDSCVVAHDLMPLYRAEREKRGDFRPIHTYTVGMKNSPDVMAAKAMVEALGGSKYVDHHIREFTPDEVFDLIPKIVYHMETYEAELIRSSIPNWLLAERAAQDVKMVLTGEGSDELFAGYLYFSEAGSSDEVQTELKRIYSMLGNINLHRTDRMTMAHGLEARVPFLDTNFTKLVMSIDPKRKVVDAEAVKNNARGREKTLLRELFEEPNDNGHSIPRPVLWRAKAMQCEGVGEDWVAILQNRIASLVSDEDMENAAAKYPLNTPHTKEELYYRQIFDEHYGGMEHVVTPWEGGGRAMGAAWKTDMYTREGLKNVNLLSHALQDKKAEETNGVNGSAASNGVNGNAAGISLSDAAREEACGRAVSSGYSEFEAHMTSGCDDRSLINVNTKANKYYIRPQPIQDSDVFRGSCTGNPPTTRGYSAAQDLFFSKFQGKSRDDVDEATREVFDDQRRRIANVLDLPEGSEVILCPSGSDAEYLPIVIAKTLRPDAKVINGVTQHMETGAGTTPASQGKFFSSHAPLLGLLKDQELLDGFDNIDSEFFKARETDGSVVDSKSAMDEFVKQALDNGQYPIVHGVFGGKTGIIDQVVPRTLDAGDTALGVVDACQMRLGQAELHQWLADDSVVLVTGSKFYQAPPFCGAVIVPPRIAAKLRASKKAPTQMFGLRGLGGFMTDKEIPPSIPTWSDGLRSKDSNIGLALRWEAGLAGMEALKHVPEDERFKVVDEWATTVTDMVNDEDGLEAWFTERSIVSIRVAKDGGGWLDLEELRDLYRWVSKDVSHLVPQASSSEKEALSTPTFIGQPVDVSETHAIVRLAMGVEAMLSYIDDPKATIVEDAMAVRKLAALGKYFKHLCRAEAESFVTPFNRTATV